MKAIALLLAGFCVGLFATAARADNLHLTPAHPAVGHPFTIDLDYVTNCSGPIGDVSAILRPPDPSVDFVHVNIETEIQCFEEVDFHAVHLSATMPGLAAGSYPIYYVVTRRDGYITPYLDTQLLGNVAVGPTAGAGAAAAPTLSTWASIVLALLLGIAVVKEKKGQRQLTIVRSSATSLVVNCL